MIKQTNKKKGNTILWKCDKGHLVTYILGMGSIKHPYKCPVCEGMEETSIGEVLHNLNSKFKTEKERG